MMTREKNLTKYVKVMRKKYGKTLKNLQTFIIKYLYLKIGVVIPTDINGF